MKRILFALLLLCATPLMAQVDTLRGSLSGTAPSHVDSVAIRSILLTILRSDSAAIRAVWFSHLTAQFGGAEPTLTANNTNNVLAIQNLSATGVAAFNFFDHLGQSRAAMGYGNVSSGTVGQPFRQMAFVEIGCPANNCVDATDFAVVHTEYASPNNLTYEPFFVGGQQGDRYVLFHRGGYGQFDISGSGYGMNLDTTAGRTEYRFKIPPPANNTFFEWETTTTNGTTNFVSLMELTNVGKLTLTGNSSALWFTPDATNVFGIENTGGKLKLYAGATWGTSYQMQFGAINGIYSPGGGFTPFVTIGDGSAHRGYVGIGTTTPTSVLAVAGLTFYATTAAARSAGLTAGAMYITAPVVGDTTVGIVP